VASGRLAVLTEYGKPLEVREYEVPDPEPGALVVRITQAPICGSDLHMWRADAEGFHIPAGGRAMGHEGTGVVYKLGAGVTTDYLGRPLQEGDRIVHSVIVGCHRCHLCLLGQENLCLNKTVTPPAGNYPYFLGTFGDYYYVAPGTPVFRVPEELSDDVLGPVNCAMGTATQAVLSAGVGQGQTVVIQGAGGLGLTATAMAKDMGAHRVIVFDRQAKRLELAREFGADTTVNIEEVNTVDERVELVFDTTEGRGADVVLEFVGMPELVSEGLKMLRRGGTYVDVGQFFSRGVEFDPSMIVMTGKRLMGSAMYRPVVLSMILDFLVRTKDTRPFASLVSHRFALEDINTAFVQSEWVAQQTPIVRAAIVP
jgi:D-arabinose 1-dehydrogenase-like Zn-dependent alcohol dehydrogenase